MSDAQQTLIAGIGSDYGDDRLGLQIVPMLAARQLCAKVKELRSPAQLLDHLSGVRRLHVIDACQGGGSVGQVARYDWPLIPLEGLRFNGTHDLGLIETLKIAEHLGLLPEECTLWGVEIVGYEPQCPETYRVPLSPPIEQALAQLVDQLQRSIHYASNEP